MYVFIYIQPTKFEGGVSFHPYLVVKYVGRFLAVEMWTGKLSETIRKDEILGKLTVGFRNVLTNFCKYNPWNYLHRLLQDLGKVSKNKGSWRWHKSF